jgi:hypothetical protein
MTGSEPEGVHLVTVDLVDTSGDETRPDGVNGMGTATVNLDYVEVAVDYRLP